MNCCGEIEEFEDSYVCTKCFRSFTEYNKSKCCRSGFIHENSYKHCEKCGKICDVSTLDTPEYSREDYPYYAYSNRYNNESKPYNFKNHISHLLNRLMCKERNKPKIEDIIPKLGQDYSMKNIKKINKKHAMYIYCILHNKDFLELTDGEILCIKFFLKPAREVKQNYYQQMINLGCINPNFNKLAEYVKLII